MKNFLILASVAAIAMTSCTKEAAENTQATGNAIEFRTVVDKTRATPMDMANLGDFKINAVAGDATTTFNFMSEVSVVRNMGAATWKYAPAKYYPAVGGNVYFYAYSPAGSVNVTATAATTVKKATINYAVPQTPEIKAQEDFLVAAAVKASGEVALTFKHALSAVKFKAENTSTHATYVVTGIELKNLADKGVLTIDGTVPATPAYTWGTPAAAVTSYKASIPASGIALVPSSGEKSLTSANELIMVLPQAAVGGISNNVTNLPTDWATAGKAYIAVSYTSYDGDFKVIEATTKYFKLTQTFAMGTMYEVAFKFDAGNMVSFKVDAVDGWPAATPVPVN